MLLTRIHLAAVAALSSVSSASAYAPVFGGPIYDPATSVGYQLRDVAGNWGPVTQAGDGVGFGNASYYDGANNYRGWRPSVWGPGYAAELPFPGTAGDPINAFRSGLAYAMNASGTIVGYAGNQPMRWTATGAQELDLVPVLGRGTMTAWALAVNAAGTTVGWAGQNYGSDSRGRRSVRWDAGGTAATVLSALSSAPDGYCDVYAQAINDAGTIAGTSTDYDSKTSLDYPVRWDAGSTTPTRLLTPDLPYSTTINAINNRGDIIGSYAPNGIRRFLRWTAGSNMGVVLGDLGRSVDPYSPLVVSSINNAGVAVGEVDKYGDGGFNGGGRAVRWDADSPAAVELANLGTDAAGNTGTGANAINDNGLIVGYAEVFQNNVFKDLVATLWDANGVPTDLNTLIDPASGWNLKYADTISNSNWVSGSGVYDPDGAGPLPGYTRAFLIQIPEPATLAVPALVTIGLGRRRYGVAGGQYRTA